MLNSNPMFLDLSNTACPSLPMDDENNLDNSYFDETVHFRLTDLCEKVLGEALDKREQVGNWAMRPLRYEQMMEYSMDWAKHMLDADITRLAEKEDKKAKKKAVKFDEAEFQKMIQRVNDDLDNTMNQMRPKDLKIIVDSMMLGLGKHLRR
ncbi:unnamed protein product [Gongylonema pulchrum]|uniref:3'-5' exonuclease domain-containing protein n=1 Tax=Gongylonema pulchrum TaxID=637853 RepID=A0A3P6QVY1_9BILA|nr:unnamed protein product [Gongylonema pulchrum]